MGQNKALFAAVLQLLRPLVRILLRNGVPYGTFSDLAKRIYVDVATKEFGIPGRKQSISRVSIITGLSRKEVSRIKKLPASENVDAIQRYHRAARVISGWLRDKRFTDGRGRPTDLLMEGRGATFSELVKYFGGDVPSRAVLDELLRVGIVKKLADGRIRLLARAYIPYTDEADKLAILGMDVRDLICTIDHNLRCDAINSFFQRKVSYDNLPGEILPGLRTRITTRAQTLLEEMDRMMSRHDRDINPSVKGTGRKRAGIGIYYFEESLQGGGE